MATRRCGECGAIYDDTHGDCPCPSKVMTPDEYQTLAMCTEADQSAILERLVKLGLSAMRLDDGARGLAGDCGEVSTAVARYIEYGQPLDRVNLLKEVGDCLWRLAQICSAAGFTLEQAMESNLAKLRLRYPAKYTNHHAAEQNRDRAGEREALVQMGHGFAEPPGEDQL